MFIALKKTNFNPERSFIPRKNFLVFSSLWWAIYGYVK